MQLKKIISVWAILVLAIAQIAIAQHSSAVHPDHGFEHVQVEDYAATDHHHEDEGAPLSHDCPECLLVKTLQTAFHVDSAPAINFTLGKNLFLSAETPFLSRRVASAYNPRAPPVLLV